MSLFVELTAERRKIRLPDKLHVHPGHWHGAVSGHGCPTWGVSCHSRGDLYLYSMINLLTLVYTNNKMSNISVCEGQGVWNVCLRCPHLRDRSGLCQVGYFCDHGKRYLSLWILPGRPMKNDEKAASLKNSNTILKAIANTNTNTNIRWTFANQQPGCLWIKPSCWRWWLRSRRDSSTRQALFYKTLFALS